MRAVIAALLLLAALPALPCSAFLREGRAGPVMGKSYDWNDERGLVLVNKRGVEKRALLLTEERNPARWRSRLASLTFNQYGRELPIGGVNEAGLAVEVLVLAGTTYERPDARPVLNELGLVQFLLDQASTTAEAIALARKVRVASVEGKLHYFMCDAQAACATLEYLGGALVVSTGAGLPVPAVTNDPYAESVAALARPGGRRGESLERFARLAARLPGAPDDDPVEAAFADLGAVATDGWTQWQIVYELGARRVHFRSRRHPTIKTVALDAFPPGCAEPVMMLDLASDARGDVTAAFVPFREEVNRALVEATLGSRRERLPPGAVRRIADHGATPTCAR